MVVGEKVGAGKEELGVGDNVQWAGLCEGDTQMGLATTDISKITVEGGGGREYLVRGRPMGLSAGKPITMEK